MSMVRRGSTVRVRQRAYLKCLQIGTLLLSARETRGHISDTSAVRATHHDVSRRLLTHVRRATASTPSNEDPVKAADLLSDQAKTPTPSLREGVIG